MTVRRSSTREKLLLFLGAGSSRASGYALTKEVLPEILRRLRSSGRGFEDRELRKEAGRLKKVLERLLPGLDDETSDDAGGMFVHARGGAATA